MAKYKTSTENGEDYTERYNPLIAENKMNGHNSQDIVDRGYIITGHHLIALASFLILSTSIATGMALRIEFAIEKLVVAQEKQNCLNSYFLGSLHSKTPQPYLGQCDRKNE